MQPQALAKFGFSSTPILIGRYGTTDAPIYVRAAMSGETGTAVTERENIAKVFKQVLKESPFYSEEVKRKEAAKYTPSKIQALLRGDPTSVLIVVDEDNQILGVNFNHIDKEPDGRETNRAWTDWTAVPLEHKGKGVGTLLRKAVIELAKKHGTITRVLCEVDASNTDSIKSLEKQGFVTVGSIPSVDSSPHPLLFYYPVE